MKERILCELDDAERKAWDSLSRYKFVMFGYWAGVWVHLNRISGVCRHNPWRKLVVVARDETDFLNMPKEKLVYRIGL